MRINKDEIKLVGNWCYINNSVKADVIAKRIEELINNYLIKITVDESGWVTLYQDPVDNRFWELSYQESESFGGGAPILEYLTENDARLKYIID